MFDSTEKKIHSITAVFTGAEKYIDLVWANDPSEMVSKKPILPVYSQSNLDPYF